MEQPDFHLLVKRRFVLDFTDYSNENCANRPFRPLYGLLARMLSMLRKFLGYSICCILAGRFAA
jgi:hypothetical protein